MMQPTEPPRKTNTKVEVLLQGIIVGTIARIALN